MLMKQIVIPTLAGLGMFSDFWLISEHGKAYTLWVSFLEVICWAHQETIKQLLPKSMIKLKRNQMEQIWVHYLKGS